MKYLYTDEKTGLDYFCSIDPSLCKKKTCRSCWHLKRYCGTSAGARRYLPPISCVFFSALPRSSRRLSGPYTHHSRDHVRIFIPHR